MSLVNTRYAEALVNLALQRNSIDEVADNINSVLELFKNEELYSFILNPENTKKLRKKILSALLEGNIRQDVLHFLLLLIDKERISVLSGIMGEYERMADNKRNILDILVYTAYPITQEQIESLREKFRVLHNASDSKITMIIDPALIGGIKVVIGDKVYDGTVKNKLAGLKAMLAEV